MSSRSRSRLWAWRPDAFRFVLVMLAAQVVALGLAGCASAASRPARWPFAHLELGLTNPLGDAASLASPVRFPLRYQYLSGGVNTGRSWQHWSRGAGTYVATYIRESEAEHIVPVFSYYQLRQSDPGASIADEAQADLDNLRDPATMRAYYQDLILFFQLASAAKGRVVLQVEPDLWGYIEQHAKHNDASSVPAAVAWSGIPTLKALPNDAAGFARAVLALRDRYAPRVIVGYHISVWGTGKNIVGSPLADHEVDRMAAKAAGFYRSLHAGYDVLFSELADRDSGYAQVREGQGAAAWWSAVDFEHHARFLAALHGRTRLPIVLWQVPVGNTLMRAMNDTAYHYQDNKLQFLLGEGSRRYLRLYLRAGVVALLFGSGQPQDTCACDADGDGVTNPPPIDGNTRLSLSADDDGGYFRAQAAGYYGHGALRLASTSPR
jgi:hypothetical protein